MKTILICGLPGSGKTFLARALVKELVGVDWYNADAIREQYNDWDFTPSGRKRQMERMKSLSAKSVSEGRYAISDFVCPTSELRKEFDADYVVWMNTIKEGRFDDTNRVFENPESDSVDLIITADEWWHTQFADTWSKYIKEQVENG